MIDIAGNSRIAGSSIDIGAYEALYDRTLVSIEDEDVGLLLEGIEKGLTEYTQEQAVKFTIKRTFNSPYLCTGFMLNGVFVDFEQYPNGWTTNITNATLADSMTIVAVYAKVASLYVDANNGKEENCGYHPKYPKKTLKSVLQLPALPGSVIYAAAGWYTNETMTSASNYGEQLSRVVVPSGISLVSLEGPEKTFIGGMVSPEPPASDTRGCGPGSIRCVTLSSKSSLIKGFTCIGGRVNCNDKTHGSYGGGVYGAGAVEDCVFIDCGATRGGGVSHASVVRRCKFINCSASYIGAALNEIAGLGVYNCIFDACTNGTHIVLNSIPLVNCTFLPSCKANTAAHSSNENAYPVAPSNIINSAIFCAPFSNPKKAMYTNCAFMRYSDISGVSLGEGSIILETNQTGILGMAKMNADGSLCSGSPLIDAGSNLLYNADFAADTALYGTQRIYNKKIDIGACEYDWRGEFSRSLRSSRSFSLMEASENVTLNAGGGVQLCGGESISVVWDRVDTASRDFSFDVDFGGEGQLTYRLGEETFTVTASNEKKTITLKGISGRLELSIAFSGEGTAIVSGFKRADNGVILLLR